MVSINSINSSTNNVTFGCRTYRGDHEPLKKVFSRAVRPRAGERINEIYRASSLDEGRQIKFFRRCLRMLGYLPREEVIVESIKKGNLKPINRNAKGNKNYHWKDIFGRTHILEAEVSSGKPVSLSPHLGL